MVNDLLGRPWAPPPTPAHAQPPAVPAGPKPPPVLPTPPPLDDTLTVDDAWELFGFPMKRGSEDDVKRHYTAFLAKWHPDRNQGDPETAEKQFKRAQDAFKLLKRHCKWP